MTAAMATMHTATTVIHCFMECREELLPNLGIPRTRFRGEIVALFRSINPDFTSFVDKRGAGESWRTRPI